MKPFILWFGKYKGRDLVDVDLGYLLWLQREPNLKRAVARELHRRQLDDMERQSKALYDAMDDELPRAEPRTVEGVYLNEIAAGRFQQAVDRGWLEITNDLPCSSPLPAVWRKWCEKRGLEPIVREEQAV